MNMTFLIMFNPVMFSKKRKKKTAGSALKLREGPVAFRFSKHQRV